MSRLCFVAGLLCCIGRRVPSVWNKAFWSEMRKVCAWVLQQLNPPPKEWLKIKHWTFLNCASLNPELNLKKRFQWPLFWGFYFFISTHSQPLFSYLYIMDYSLELNHPSWEKATYLTILIQWKHFASISICVLARHNSGICFALKTQRIVKNMEIISAMHHGIHCFSGDHQSVTIFQDAMWTLCGG